MSNWLKICNEVKIKDILLYSFESNWTYITLNIPLSDSIRPALEDDLDFQEKTNENSPIID